MKSRQLYARIQGLVGSLFLTAGFLFIFLVVFSVSAAFADPVQAEVLPAAASAQSPRGILSASVQRGGGAVRGVRGASGNTRSSRSVQQNANNGREATAAVALPSVQSRGVAVRGGGATRTTAAAAQRTVRSRAPAAAIRATGQARSVIARSGGIQQARVGLTGSAIRASTGTIGSTLTTKLAQATYSNLIDPTTGMLSADSYSNCLSSYYTCMDEICTARNPGQRRCACAGRVKTFNTVEATLQTAKEDLLKVSGELSLLIASKGESIHSAFELTDAEKSLNCVSFRDEKKRLGANASMKAWCDAHLMLDTASCESSMNSTCNTLYGNGTGDAWMNILNGADSDILTSLQTYADTLNEVNTFNYSNEDNLFSSFNNVDLIVNGSNSVFETETSVDKLAQTWGYELFQYAHNNVCGRVLDSCFNGIYEMCGNRPTSQGGGSGPYNMNSDITVNGNDIEFVTPKGTTASTGTAACFGYTSTSGDPYSTLRQPIADARLSILQKYVLDANADCDVYGEELKKQAQNMAYQKIAATQLLQKKRLEFTTEKENNRLQSLATAKENYLKCIDEIMQCRQDKNRESGWTGNTTRIKNFCNQMSNVPTCYEQMVCNQEATGINSSVSDSSRNTVLLSEIVAASQAPAESCMLNTLNVGEIRGWSAPATP
ncbi:MAG: hypothetical protein LBT45_00895 [Rickettsiales bacterium]|jgi:hypothetical protein|nr:hypothetical protein [Rickettsiales bacterium]